MTPAYPTPKAPLFVKSGPREHPGYNDSRISTRGQPLRKGDILSRIVRPESAARFRERILQSTALAIRHAATQSPDSSDRHDVFAFIVLALSQVCESVETSAAAWEKRGYWLKADRFRRDWAWAEQLKGKIEAALRDQDYAAAGDAVGQLSGHLTGVKIPARVQRTTPWQGSWDRWQAG
jgi:hypothetical protein